jgi:hypothetical protein
MRRSGRLASSLALALVAAFAGVSTAVAQAPGFGNTHGAEPRYGYELPDSDKGSLGGDNQSSVMPNEVRPSEMTPEMPLGTPTKEQGSHRPLRRSCKRKLRPRRRVCRFMRGRRVVKVCVKRPGRRRTCKARSRATEAAPRARVAELRGQGFTDPVLPPVVRFYLDGKGWCSGTLVLRGIVLTAGHCLYGNAENNNAGWYQNTGRLQIAPGNYVNSSGTTVYPYGVWEVVDSYVPPRWQNNDGGQDWGVAVIGADANGSYPADFTGTYGAVWGQQFPIGSRIWRAGYPASFSFSTAEWYYGNGQYYCDNRWDGASITDVPYTQSSYGIVTSPCPMNGGSSGGPVFLNAADGSWRIVGVNNRGWDGSNGFATGGISFWFDDEFGQFWTGAINAINSARASTARRRAVTASAVR